MASGKSLMQAAAEDGLDRIFDDYKLSFPYLWSSLSLLDEYALCDMKHLLELFELFEVNSIDSKKLEQFQKNSKS